MVFIDLEKSYDAVTREVLWRYMRKRNITETSIMISAVQVPRRGQSNVLLTMNVSPGVTS